MKDKMHPTEFRLRRRQLAVPAATALLAALAGSAFAQSATPASQAIPKSGSAPEQLPDDARPIEARPDIPKATEIRAPDEAKLLLGRKPLAWKKLSEQRNRHAGFVEIVDDNGLWRIKGEQKGVAPGQENDLVRIDGVILRILPNMFTIAGEVSTRAAAVLGGVACKQSGTVTFRRHPRDPFWRLLDNENPCTGEREIIEIVMDPPPAAPKKTATAPQPKKN